MGWAPTKVARRWTSCRATATTRSFAPPTSVSTAPSRIRQETGASSASMAATGVHSTTTSQGPSHSPGPACTSSATPSATARPRTSSRVSAAATRRFGSRAFRPRASDAPMSPSPTMPTWRGSGALTLAAPYFPPAPEGGAPPGPARSGRSTRAPRR